MLHCKRWSLHSMVDLISISKLYICTKYFISDVSTKTIPYFVFFLLPSGMMSEDRRMDWLEGSLGDELDGRL